MRLHEQPLARMNLVGRYGPGEVHINGRRLTAPLVVAPGFLQEDWVTQISMLTPEALAPVWEQQPRIVLLGSDDRAALPLKTLRGLFAERQIALEAMDLGAACRTYNVLAQEDRAVVALLFP
jgi:uncharacterized protein